MYHFEMKRATTFQLALPARNGTTPAYRWLYAALRSEILAGNLRAGTRLPATRDLAGQYGLSRGTIVNAFEQLRSEGYVEGSVGSGTYVSKTLPEALLQVAPGENSRPGESGRPPVPVSDYGRRAKLFPGYESRPIRAFRPNLPALDLFPAELWAQVTARILRRVSLNQLMGCAPLGYTPLRKAVADYLRASRGVKCDAEQVAIVSGVQEALDLTARLFLNPGDRVGMEAPGYPGAAMVFAACGAKISGFDVDEEGIRVSRLPAQGVRLVYVTPGHQFPLGTTMTLARRLQLLEWARNAGALIFEDDYDSEYRYSGRPIPALQGLDRGGCVLYAGSFSKVLFPGLRLGYLVVPAHLLDRVEAIKSLTSRHASSLEQAVLSEFIHQGHFGRHLRRMRQVYAERLSVLLEEARRRLAGLLEISTVEAGLQTAGWLGAGLESESIAAAAATRNVEVIPLSRYGRVTLPRQGLQLGFAALNHGEIKRGVERLATTIEREWKILKTRNNLRH
jgi:GntR family transcriptional regulator/MocR family aminotransferase